MAYKSFDDFWHFYLKQHKNSKNRLLHYFGTGFVLLLTVFCFAFGELRYLYLLPIVGYLPAWLGHYVFEKNKPATFQNPIYSLVADFKMFFLFVSGTLSKHLKK